MDLGMVGLGRMGANMSERLIKGGHRVVGFDPRPEAVRHHDELGGVGASTLVNMVGHLAPPRTVWLMVPSGKAVDDTIEALLGALAPGDVIIDGGNSYYRDSIGRAGRLAGLGVGFLDVGTSGGIWGLREGFCLMVGGDRMTVDRLASIFQTLAPAPTQGWGYVGPTGSGHFVKMIHNAIEYGMMQAYAEGFELMNAKDVFHLDLLQVAEIWRYGSVVRSWLLDLTARAFTQYPKLEGIAPYVPDSGEGRWTVMESIELARSVPVITLALQNRFRSRESAPFGDRLLAALREQFGGHEVKRVP
jgi:6-phosphogluconate dehydrogenase